ncbi:TPA: head-tail connector protein [Klebsiella oxytoca]
MGITLEEMRRQCRIDENDGDDSLLTDIYLPAAIRGAESRINRKLYDDAVPSDDETGLVIADDIKLAVLMLVGHFYENREATTSGKVANLPTALDFLLDPWRLIPL